MHICHPTPLEMFHWTFSSITGSKKGLMLIHIRPFSFNLSGALKAAPLTLSYIKST
jgi:hypothetical protein